MKAIFLISILLVSLVSCYDINAKFEADMVLKYLALRPSDTFVASPTNSLTVSDIALLYYGSIECSEVILDANPGLPATPKDISIYLPNIMNCVKVSSLETIEHFHLIKGSPLRLDVYDPITISPNDLPSHDEQGQLETPVATSLVLEITNNLRYNLRSEDPFVDDIPSGQSVQIEQDGASHSFQFAYTDINDQVQTLEISCSLATGSSWPYKTPGSDNSISVETETSVVIGSPSEGKKSVSSGNLLITISIDYNSQPATASVTFEQNYASSLPLSNNRYRTIQNAALSLRYPGNTNQIGVGGFTANDYFLWNFIWVKGSDFLIKNVQSQLVATGDYSTTIVASSLGTGSSEQTWSLVPISSNSYYIQGKNNLCWTVLSSRIQLAKCGSQAALQAFTIDFYNGPVTFTI